MTSTQLTQQLSQLSKSLKTTGVLITRLAKLNFQPGSESLDSEESVRVELAGDIHDSLKQLEEDLELLQQASENYVAGRNNQKRRDSKRDGEREKLAAQVARLSEDLKRARSSFRKAQLSAKRASDAAKQKEREIIFSSLQSAPEPGPTDIEGQRDLLFAGRRKLQHKQLSKDEALVAASTDVTAALRRTHNLLSTELSRSRFAQETFDQSTAALKELGEQYSNLDTILSNSRNLLGTLLRSQKSDTWYLETAFYILLATLCWLFFRRILFGPFVRLPLFFWNTLVFLLNWVVWKPLFLFLTVTGVYSRDPVQIKTRVVAPTVNTSRPPLIIKPSASTGPIVMTPEEHERFHKEGVPAGGGGSGAKKDPEGMSGSLSEEVGKMAEKKQEEEKDLPRRGDGTVLQERGADEPPNPKKKMFEADVEDKKQRRKRDEL